MSLHKMLRAAAGYQAPAPANTDPQFNYVSMLLHGDGTNGSQNNTFVDSSTNNFTITRNGNTTQGSLSPYGSLWSNYFDGSGDYLTAPDNAAFNFGSGDFTVEMWLYPTALGQSGYTFIYLKPNASGYSGVAVLQDPSSYAVKLYSSSTGSSWDLANGATIGTLTPNAWNHVAVSRSGTNMRAFLNGALGSTTSVSTSSLFSTTNPVYIGSSLGNPNTFYTGYISNLRAVKGTAVYTAAFTPPTAPLTAITNTALLTCQSNRFIDNSANNFTITRNGDVRVTKESPFLPTAAYSTSTIGGSGYFDGSDLSVANNTALDLTSGNWTVEGWFYATSFPNSNSHMIVCKDGQSGVTYAQYSVYVGDSTNRKLTASIGSGASGTGEQVITGATSVSTNTWNHFAFTFDGTTLRLFLNGSLDASAAKSFTMTNGTYPLSIARQNNNTTNRFFGYISNLRIVKGTAVYTAAFTPPTAPLTAITNTSLLLNFTNAGIFDNAAENDLETVGNAQISTSVKKYGSGSMRFTAATDYLIPSESLPCAFGSGNFTIEMWIYLNAYPSSYGTIYDARPSGGNGAYAAIYMDTANLYYYVNTTNAITVSLSTIGTGTWRHLAISRSGTSTKMFVDGVQVGSTYTDTTTYLNPAQRPVIGGGGNAVGTYPMNGYIDDLRITKGYARYTANFTPPTAAFPDQ